MIYSSYKNIKISAIAVAVPENVRAIDSLTGTVGEVTINRFIKKTGIKSVYISDHKHTAADYGVRAIERIKQEGKFDTSEIGILINVTQTPDYRSPSTACVMHYRLGLNKSCMAFDVNLGCSGFVYGLNIAASLLLSSNTQKAIVVIGDTQARGRTNGSAAEEDIDSNTMMLFGDATAAILLEKKDSTQLDFGLMSDGEGYKALAVPYGAWKHPVGPEIFPGDDIRVFNFAISEVPSTIRAFLDKLNKSIDDYDAIVFHQANRMILKQIAKKIKIPDDKLLMSLEKYGNTGGASIPVTIANTYGTRNDERVSLLTCGFGVGLSWGCSSFEIDVNDIYPIELGADCFEDGYPDSGTMI